MIGHPPTPDRDCPRCNGEGERVFNPSWPFDPQEETSEMCRACNGTGKVPIGGRKDSSHGPRLETRAHEVVARVAA